MAKLVYFVSVSHDGYIAAPDGSTDGFEIGPELIDFIGRHYPDTLPTHVREHLGVTATGSFGSVLMGRRTYEVGSNVGIGSPYQHLEQYVVSRSLTRDPAQGVHCVSSDLAPVVRELKARAGKDVWLCGGGVLAGALLGEIDELVLKRQPVVFGAGVPLVAGAYTPARFERVEEETVGAVVVSRYRRR